MSRPTPQACPPKRNILIWSSGPQPPRRPRRRPLGAAIGALVRWRSELSAAAILVLTYHQLALWSDPLTAALALLGSTLAFLGTPPLRRRIREHVVGLAVRHRFQGLCKHSAMRDPEGRLPLVLRCETEGDSVFLLLWLRRGMTPELVYAHRSLIRTACAAADVVPYPHPMNGALLTLRVVHPWGL
ncbi:hypothetical protein [Thermoactinospora rubra]|uniref:hypothetical protein n=1 Tax=Thermoactinospora rubra TaxID=1088767 RepID=UPI000A10C781|nr:hypothetical protein [Thermoactinospora rubra]